MTEHTAQEPTMEEILASIRRIISEDDAPAEPSPSLSTAPSLPEAAPDMSSASEPSADEAAAAPEEDVLELTDTYESSSAESIGDLEVSASPAASPDPAPREDPTSAASALPTMSEPPAAPGNGYDPLVGESAAASAASAFAGLASSLRKPDPIEHTVPSGPTLDELVRSLLRPMLKDWLDANLPAIVEAQVRKEVERIARTAG
jgi:cell pole-organizing protein PopZ